MRGSDLEEGDSEGLPIWSEHVGDPVLASNRTRRIDFALFMVEAPIPKDVQERCVSLSSFTQEQKDAVYRHRFHVTCFYGGSNPDVLEQHLAIFKVAKALGSRFLSIKSNGKVVLVS